MKKKAPAQTGGLKAISAPSPPMGAEIARQSNGDGALAVVVAAALAASLPLAWLGRALSAHTHHRPLGAVTFALIALMTVCAFMLVGYRAVFRDDRRRVKLRFRGLIVVACVSLAGSVGLALQ